jgi:hypothetical protein
MNTPPPSLREQLPTLPEAVERVVFKALAKAPEDRFARIQQFADALREAVQPPIVLSPPIETINTARLEPARQTTDVPASHQKSVPVLPTSLPANPRNVAFPSLQKDAPGRRFSWLTGRSLGLILLLVILVVALLGGGMYYVAVSNSTSQLSNARALIDRANVELTQQDPVDALKQLALAQNALLGVQGPFLGDQATQYHTLQESLQKTFQKAVTAYNQKELITRLPCSVTREVSLNGKVQALSLSTMRDEKGTPYWYVLATGDKLYRLDEQDHRLKDARPFPNSAHALSLTSNGQHLFALTSQSGSSATTYSLSMFSYDGPPKLKEDPVDVDNDLVKEGWTPLFVTAYGADVFLILMKKSTPRTMILSYDANNWRNTPQKLQTDLAPDVVSVAAFPGKRLFFLTSDGHIKHVTYGDGASASAEEISLQNPVSPPLVNDGANLTPGTPFPTPWPQSSQVGRSAQIGVTFLMAGSLGSDNPHLYVVDNPHHRIMDLKFIPSSTLPVTQTTPSTSGTSTPTPIPTASSGGGVINPSSLKLQQQFASTTLLSSVKSATVSSDGKKLYLLTQSGSTLTTISAIDKAPSC